MKICVDTNVLVRVLVRDDEAQAQAADRLLWGASVIAVTLPILCELVWVLRRVYGYSGVDTIAALEALMGVGKVAVNRDAVGAGLAVLRAGGDFADGVIAYEGRWLGGETFLSFDRKAVALVRAQGHVAQLAG